MHKLFSIIVLILLVNLVPAQVSKTVVVSEPGTLSGLLPVSERGQITSLTISGQINAKDFFLLRDSVPNLAELDVSNVIIAEYFGTNGLSTESMLFPANEIPYICFFKGSITKYNTILSGIKLPVSAKSIGDMSFVNCTNLGEVEIPDGIERISKTAFVGSTIKMMVNSQNNYFSSQNGVLYNKKGNVLIHCPITQTGEFKVQKGIDSLDHFSFYGCSRIQSFELPSSIRFIGSLAFSNCYGITSFRMNVNSERLNYSSDIFDADTLKKSTLYVPYGTKTMFSQMKPWSNFGSIIASDQGFCADKSTVSVLCKAGSSSISISSTVNWTAEANESWLNLSKSSGLPGTEVLEFTFQENQSVYDRKALVTINSPGLDAQTVEIIQAAAPRVINLTAGNLVTEINQVDRLTTKSVIVKGTIDARDFRVLRDSMPMLEEVNLKEASISAYSGVEGTRTEITTYKENCLPPYAFMSGLNYIYHNIKKIYLPVNTVELGDAAFAMASTIDSVYVGEKLEAIGTACFQNCVNLVNITLPATVKTIKSYAFLTCRGLSSLVVNSPTPVNLSSEYFVFSDIDFSKCKLKVPYGSATSYAKANQWKQFTNIVEFKNTVNADRTLLNTQLKVHPNPVTDKLTISNFEGCCSMNLTDLNGKIIISRQIVPNESINIVSLPAGVYILNLNTPNGEIHRKIVKK